MFDVINTHFAIPSGPTGYVLSRYFRLPNVLSIHGGDIYDPTKTLSPHRTPLLLGMVRTMLRTADRVVAQSSDTRDNAYRYYGVARPIDIIPLGIKRIEFAHKARSEFGFSAEDTILCSLGRLVKRKNLEETIRIVSALDRKDGVRFIIMGDGPERANLERLIRQLDLENVVKIFGVVSDQQKFQLLSVSDIYLSTSLHEGFCLAFLEAMDCGLPVVCYDRGGHNDFLLEGKTGYLIRCGDSTALGRKLAELIAARDLRTEMGLFNRTRVKDFYVERCAERYLSLFEDVISSRLARGGA
jgi:glycosyltransferase involved in cell wall biosynthesis